MISLPMNKFFRNDQSKQKVYTWAGKWALVLGALYLTSLYSYLLFHTFAEIFSTAVALAIFLLLWNVRRSMDNNYLLFIGVAYLFVGALDLLHTLAYKGMGVFEAYQENVPAQLWVGVRYIQSLSFLVAPFFLGKRLNLKFVVASYLFASFLLLGSIFSWEVFPACFVPGVGLTPFKIWSEYAIGLILLAAIAMLLKRRWVFDPAVFRLLIFSIALTIVSELIFTLYEDVYGSLNFFGHFLKIAAFFCIYKAIVELGVAKPFAVLFRDINQSKEALKKAHESLERQIEERTADLVKTCEQLRESETKYRIVAENNYDWEWWIDPDGRFIYVSPSCKEITLHSREEFASDQDLLLRLVHPEDQDSFSRHLIDIEEKSLTGELEFRILRADGSTRWIAHACKPVFDEEGRFLGRRGSNRDITARKKADESVRNALFEIKILKDRLEAENIYFRQELSLNHQLSHIIGESNAIKYILYRAEQVAPSNTTVLILGETGTGKDMIAGAIHQMSPRKDRPLITLNCAALPANLMESELFGREKGAFTGADARQMGRFEIANGSTLCLDEIGELPLELQAKLLRVIQHGEFERLGSSRTIRVDVRILATTNRNLEEEVRKGRFRQDLFYRLNVFPITVPPLGQRKNDIPLLVQVFAERYAKRHGKEFTSIQSETMKALQGYNWPGNVRELENVIERAVILCPGPVLQLADKLENEFFQSSPLRTLEDTEREQILKTLSETGWRINGKKGAAAILGLNPSTLRARMHKLGINRPEAKI